MMIFIARSIAKIFDILLCIFTTYTSFSCFSLLPFIQAGLGPRSRMDSAAAASKKEDFRCFVERRRLKRGTKEDGEWLVGAG